MTTAETQTQEALAPAQGDEPVVPAADAETLAAAAETADEAGSDNAESGDDSTTDDSKEDNRAEREKQLRRLQRRNEKLLQDRAVERSERERLAAELARLQQSLTDEGQPKAETVDPEKLAEAIAIRKETAKALKAVTVEGQAKFKDFEQAIGDLVEEIGPQLDQNGHPTPLMAVVLDSDRPTELLRYLGLNTEVAAELVGLSPARLGRRIAAIESELKAKAAPPKPSGAAKPLAPVKPSAPVTVDPTKLTDAQWHAMRRKERLSA